MTLYLIAFAHNHTVHMCSIDTQLLQSEQQFKQAMLYFIRIIV